MSKRSHLTSSMARVLVPRQAGRILLVLAALLLPAAVALAQTGGEYDLTWWTVDGGGGTVASGGYTLAGTAGQPEAGAILAGGDYTLVGGFWPGGAAAGYKLYLPLVLRQFL